MTTTIERPATLSQEQLRIQRIQIYRSNVKHSHVIPCINGKRLSPASVTNRTTNFHKFVDLYFSKIILKDNHSLESDNYGLATKLTKNSDGYKAFYRFSKTDYGSSVIKEMVNNVKKYKGFSVKEAFGKSAVAAYSTILLPKKFPNQPSFKASGQRIYDLAIIYHEFSHTMLFRSTSSKNKKISIYDERTAVINFENPVRKHKGYEPRYTYTRDKPGETINIITGEKKPGVWLVSRYDPTKLIKPTHKDALK